MAEGNAIVGVLIFIAILVSFVFLCIFGAVSFVFLCIFGAVSFVSPELATVLGISFGLLVLGSFALFLFGNRE
jgi:hypothetical protein